MSHNSSQGPKTGIRPQSTQFQNGTRLSGQDRYDRYHSSTSKSNSVNLPQRVGDVGEREKKVMAHSTVSAEIARPAPAAGKPSSASTHASKQRSDFVDEQSEGRQVKSSQGGSKTEDEYLEAQTDGVVERREAGDGLDR